MLKRNHSLGHLLASSCLVAWVYLLPVRAQTEVEDKAPPGEAAGLAVNWIYGAYVPKDGPLLPLTNNQRRTLYFRQTFTSPGIYVKTALFSLGDQMNGSPPEWGGGFAGFGRRVASRQGQFVIQNSISTVGNALLGYEPRYDRCHCSGLWPRTRHALLRNFVTYDRTETAIRPQFASYGAAIAAGAIASAWKPHSDAWAEGYRSALTQVGFGIVSNWLGEFAPEITRVIRRRKSASSQK
jgi:hypothetical protein